MIYYIIVLAFYLRLEKKYKNVHQNIKICSSMYASEKYVTVYIDGIYAIGTVSIYNEFHSAQQMRKIRNVDHLEYTVLSII